MESLKKEYENFLKINQLETDTHFYTQQEWQSRGEPYGNAAELSLTFEGALYRVLNYEGGGLEGQFYEIAKKYGYMVELGYAWSAHFYKLDNTEIEHDTETKH